MLVTDQGKLIRLGIDFRHLIENGFEENLGLSVIGRGSSGVRLFNVAEDEQIVSVARIEEREDDEGDVGQESGTDETVTDSTPEDEGTPDPKSET